MKVRHIVPTKGICPVCNGLGFIDGKLCYSCGGSGEEEVYVCSSCGAFEEECRCFDPRDLPAWCSCDPSWGSKCPAPEEAVREAIENLLSYCPSCPYSTLRRAA